MPYSHVLPRNTFSYQWWFSATLHPIQRNVDVKKNNSSNNAAVSFPSLRVRTVTYSTYSKVSDWAGEGAVSGKWPICNYFLLNQHKVAASQRSALAWIKTTCGAGWRKALAQQAPKESAAPFPCKFPRLFDTVKHLIVGRKEKKKNLGFGDYRHLWF